MMLSVEDLQIHYATRDGVARAVDGAGHAVAGAVVDLQLLDGEHHRPRSLGMKTSS